MSFLQSPLLMSVYPESRAPGPGSLEEREGTWLEWPPGRGLDISSCVLPQLFVWVRRRLSLREHARAPACGVGFKRDPSHKGFPLHTQEIPFLGHITVLKSLCSVCVCVGGSPVQEPVISD